MPTKGCGIWNERPMPRWQRVRAAMRVTSMPSKRIVPASACTVPAIRLNSVVLPAPFGPMMPERLALGERQRDVVGDLQGAVAFRQVGDGEEVGHATRPGP